MLEKSLLLLPRPSLANCIFAAIVRDTRGHLLSDNERINHFPASPLVALTYVIEGETFIVPKGAGLEQARQAAPLPALTITGPQSEPVTSWNPGLVLAISIGLYPDAWAKLTGIPPLTLADKTTSDILEPLPGIIEMCRDIADIPMFWQAFCDALEPRWQLAQGDGGNPAHTGKASIANWARSLIAHAALSGPGKSLRATERRLRRWAGQNRQSLSFYASIEELYQKVSSGRPSRLSGIAYDAGFSDQSHMGRAVRRATGFSPARLNHLIATEEAFWCYRLLGERF